ncbi:16849_t:CDS:2, partial [Cetraspora pellucida]
TFKPYSRYMSVVENYLSPLKIIPNYHLTELVRANTLYDMNESLFRRIFWNTDNLLHPSLQVNSKCLSVLKRMGLKYQVNSVTFLECVHEIDSRIKRFQSQQLNDQINLVKSDARLLMEYFYEHLTTLYFTNEQWLDLISIKFVPVDTDLESPLKETTAGIKEFESINSMCYQEYKLLCWTQCPLFSKSIDPPNAFKSRFPSLCLPTINMILDNLHYVALDISQAENDSWKSPEGVQLILDILKKTYKALEDWVKTQVYWTNTQDRDNVNWTNSQVFNSKIISRLQTDARIFLNGYDPFIPEDWVAGQNLVFGAQEDVRTGLHKVHENLEGFKLLLRVAGAREIKNIKFNVKTQDYSQANKLLGRLLDSFEKHDTTMHHDVEFQIHHENGIEKIKANRYVLSAASEHFERLFCGSMMEAAEDQKVTVDIHNIEPSAFRVLIRWLYGQKLEEAISAVFKDSKCSDVFLVDLLKVSDQYQVDPLKGQVEVKIIQGSYVNIDNAVEINEWAKLLRTTQLNNYCEQYIKENKSLVIEKKIDS